jgi:hypothetical protein
MGCFAPSRCCWPGFVPAGMGPVVQHEVYFQSCGGLGYAESYGEICRSHSHIE